MRFFGQHRHFSAPTAYIQTLWAEKSNNNFLHLTFCSPFGNLELKWYPSWHTRRRLCKAQLIKCHQTGNLDGQTSSYSPSSSWTIPMVLQGLSRGAVVALAHIYSDFEGKLPLFHSTQCKYVHHFVTRVVIEFWPHPFVTHSCLWRSYLLTAVWALHGHVKHWIDPWVLQVY